MLPLDLLADLPEPSDDEPSSLRADIADELADHLQCAFRREVLKDGDAAAAQRRALDRFGDPKQLARRLWRQAMWSRIMRQRIVSGLQWMVAVTAMLISGAVFWQQSQLLAELRHARQEDAAERQALTAKLDRLELPTATAGMPVYPSSPSGPPPTYEYSATPVGSEPTPGAYASTPQSEMESPPGPSEYGQLPLSRPALLTLSFVQETEDGPPVSPRSVSLTSSDGGEHIEERSSLIALNTNVPPRIEYPNGRTAAGAEGVYRIKSVFRSLEPDLYQLRIELDDGQWSERLVSIRDEKPQELTIVCPGPRTKKAPVSMSIKPLPDWMQKKRFEIEVEVRAAPIEIGQAKWATSSLPTQSIRFDARTGLPVAISAMTTRGSPELDLRDLPAEERRVFLPVGAVAYRFEVNERPVEVRPVRVYQWPESSLAEDGFRHVIEAHDNTWELELPQEFLEEVARDVRASEPPPSDPLPAAAADPAHEGVLPAQPVSAPDVSKQLRILDQLQGRWMVIDGRAMMQGGNVVANKNEYAGMSFFFHGNTAFSAKGLERGDPLPFSIDVTKNPMWIDLDAMKGTFRLENDSLTICFGIERPPGLDLAQGIQAERYVLKRAVLHDEPDKRAEPAEQRPDPLAQRKLEGAWIPLASPEGRTQVQGVSIEAGTIIIAGDRATRGDGKVECKIAVNGATLPWRIDIGSSALLSIYNPDDPSEEEPLEGIVRLEGDTLTMCLAPAGQRPAKFDEENFPVFVFKRKAQP